MEQKEKFTGIKRQLFIPICIVIVVTLLMSFFAVNSMVDMQGRMRTLQSETIAELEDIQQIRYQILHTAEILTDVSATHDEEGFEEAAEFSEEINSLIDGIIARDSSKAAEWNGIRASYEGFYDMLCTMARAYIDEGIEAGNEVMELVDPMTEELSEVVDATTEGIENELEVSVQTLSVKAQTVSILVLVTAVLFIVFIVYIAIIVLKKMVSPVINVSRSLRSLADHDLTIDKIESTQKDEIGGLIYAFNTLRDSLRDIMTNLDTSAGDLETLSTEMADQSERISNNVSEITRAVSNVAEIAVSQATDIDGSMKELNELQSIAEQNARVSDNLSDASSRISQASEEGNKVLDELYAVSKESETSFGEIFTSIERIKESTAKIGEASSMIDSIAGQTNLLSLNASIEAARAGEAGRGFSVVADEIRSLSDESARSVQEINLMIRELQVNVENATRQSSIVRDAVAKQTSGVEDTRSSYKAIADNLTSINTEIEELSRISKTMQDNCTNVSAVMQNLSSAAEQNAASTEETTASIEEVLSMTEQINNGTGQVKERTDVLNSVVKTYKL
ncbi:MAG: methyl-accepting chemotaxis protein [Lachnospiraceae bacterium]|nr:methyl-accepting chemotaxis protein [Lachnospiraceae bacterium]